ncbi:hypothetical protein CDOO_00880 [Corynebacterium doosanense CAU 212 = DSM 45436]|uniref:Uncharacterized protein n=1 Tax=Corynebacterium doosanense CAU 212 = DSM 45436 TaxID=558173 RepID=A0A097IJ39_9CORY|nr:hypothetical protein CDOO_00880 [Corynebacterium doosanense CAU 212 = DSM 45436]
MGMQYGERQQLPQGLLDIPDGQPTVVRIAGVSPCRSGRGLGGVGSACVGRHGQIAHGGRACLVQASTDPRDGALQAVQVASTRPLAHPAGCDQGGDQVADLTGEGGVAQLVCATACPGAAAGNALGDHLGRATPDAPVRGSDVVAGAVIRVGG